jgi:hypothetical protein
MNAATVSALLLFTAGLLQSLRLLCQRLPPQRRPAHFPIQRGALLIYDLVWIGLCGGGFFLAFSRGTVLGLFALAIYFVVLPFVFQLPLARLLGFPSFRAYLDAVDRYKDEP